MTGQTNEIHNRKIAQSVKKYEMHRNQNQFILTKGSSGKKVKRRMTPNFLN